MFVKLICPQCGAPSQMDDSRGFIFCQFCGTRIQIIPQQHQVSGNININQQVVHSGTVMHQIDRSNEPNLHINYASSSQAVGMVVNIKAIRQKSHFVNGQTMTFRLPPGEHKIVLKIGKINYNRIIRILPNNMPVKIYASWNKRAHITIDQP